MFDLRQHQGGRTWAQSDRLLPPLPPPLQSQQEGLMTLILQKNGVTEAGSVGGKGPCDEEYREHGESWKRRAPPKATCTPHARPPLWLWNRPLGSSRKNL